MTPLGVIFQEVMRMSFNQKESLPEIKKVVVINAPKAEVWKAIATSEGIAGWWLKNDFRPIEGYKFKIHDDSFGDSQCVVTRVDPPTHLEFDWDNDWHLAFYLHEIDTNKTELTFTHSGWFSNKKTRFGQPHEQVRKIIDAGWEKGIRVKLVGYVEK